MLWNCQIFHFCSQMYNSLMGYCDQWRAQSFEGQGQKQKRGTYGMFWPPKGTGHHILTSQRAVKCQQRGHLGMHFGHFSELFGPQEDTLVCVLAPKRPPQCQLGSQEAILTCVLTSKKEHFYILSQRGNFGICFRSKEST